MPKGPEIQTIWRTAAEHCEVVIGQFTGFHVRLWVQSRLVIDETLYDFENAVKRAWELRLEWSRLTE
jgi:hypothetical protein